MLNTSTIITTNAIEPIQSTHEQMPVNLYPESEVFWLAKNEGF
ncbi:SOS response-associated peptidase family protein [Pontibacter burrus]